MLQPTLPNLDQEIDCRYIEPGPMLEMALNIATEAHKGQTRRDGTDYVSHPIGVSQLLSEPTDIILGLLHDVIEDTSWTQDKVSSTLRKATDAKNYCIDEIMLGLYLLTHNKKLLSYDEYVTRLTNNPVTVRVKLADIFYNLADDPTKNQKAKYFKAIPILLATL